LLKLCFELLHCKLLVNSEVSGERDAAIFRVTEMDSKVLANLPSNPEREGCMLLQNIRIVKTYYNMTTITANLPARLPASH